MKKILPYIVIILLILAGDAGAMFWYKKQSMKEQATYSNNMAAMQKQISSLQTDLDVLSKKNSSAVLSAQEQVNRQLVEQKSQSQLVTAAVAKNIPAVVSIIISQDVPQYQVQYENPFGNDPSFQSPGMEIPVYVPTGQTTSQEVGAGTGFIITPDGYILTNRHVVADTSAGYTVLLSNGRQQVANVVYRDPNNDVAVIKISGSGLPTVNFGNSSTLQLGETVIAIGNALGQYNNSVSVGVVSGLNRTIQPSDQNGNVETLTGIIQTDASINPGNSGGPLLDTDGNVMGINVATVQGSNNIGFSIPINTVKGIIKTATGKQF